MTLKEFLVGCNVPKEENIAIFRDHVWGCDGAPEFVCTAEYLTDSGECNDLLDIEVTGVCSGGEISMCWLSENDVSQNVIEVGIDWDGDEY